MQTFIVKLASETLTASDIRHMLWQGSELGKDEILVEEQ